MISDFWNPVTITGVSILALVFIILVSACFYEIGKSRVRKYLKRNISENEEGLRVPRVTKYYVGSNSMQNLDGVHL